MSWRLTGRRAQRSAEVCLVEVSGLRGQFRQADAGLISGGGVPYAQQRGVLFEGGADQAAKLLFQRVLADGEPSGQRLDLHSLVPDADLVQRRPHHRIDPRCKEIDQRRDAASKTPLPASVRIRCPVFVIPVKLAFGRRCVPSVASRLATPR